MKWFGHQQLEDTAWVERMFLKIRMHFPEYDVVTAAEIADSCARGCGEPTFNELGERAFTQMLADIIALPESA